MRDAVGVKRMLGMPLALLALALGLTACEDDDADRAKVDAADARLVAAVDGVIHDAAEQLDLTFEGGSRHYAICGESYAPRGVKIRGTVRLTSLAELTDDEAADAVAALLDEQGWQVERPPLRSVVEGTKDDLTLRFDIRGVSVDLVTECIETSGDVARESAEREGVALEWK